MDSYFLAALKEAQSQGAFVSIYLSGDDPDTHMTGSVLDVTLQGVTLQHYSPDGAPDGEVLVRMDSVFHIDINGRYERRVAYLAKNYADVFR